MTPMIALAMSAPAARCKDLTERSPIARMRRQRRQKTPARPGRSAAAPQCAICPDALLDEIQQHRQHDQEDHDAEADLLALDHASAPPPSSGTRRRPWRNCRASAGVPSVYLTAPSGERLRHRDLVAGIIEVPLRIVRLRVAGQDRVDVVGADLLVLVERSASKMNQGKPRSYLRALASSAHVRRRLAERGRGGLVVGERVGRREDVGRRAGPLEHLALVVRLVVGDLVARRQRLDLIFAEAGTVGLARACGREC